MLKPHSKQNATSTLLAGVSAIAVISFVGMATSASAQDAEQIETVTVTGFRASLEKALDMKRSALDSSDSIMAEDIAKFPDMNVSESLQRIPGVAITRDAGEGRTITVRGLGPLFSRVRINGMEAMSTAGGSDASGGTNRGRGFDFNVFGSELFSGLTVNKTASASMEEGSLGATIDMHTARPFDYSGFVFSASGSYGYNDLAGSMNPRMSFLVSDTFLGGRLGVLFSASYNVRHLYETGDSTVRMSATGNTNVTVDSSGTKGTVIRPRMPRYEFYKDASKRIGLASTVQFQPEDGTLFTLSALFSDFASQREEHQLEMQTNSFGTLTGIGNQVYEKAGGYYYQPVLQSASGAKIRTEHRLDHLDTRFMQVTLEGSHAFGETFKVNSQVGWSESHHRNPIQDYIMLDQTNVNNYGYDYSGDNQWAPNLNYGSADLTVSGLPSVPTSSGASGCTSGANCWFVSSFRRRPQYNFNSFRSAAIDFEYKPVGWLSVTGGLSFKNYGFRTESLRLSTGASTNMETFASAYGSAASASSSFYGSGTTSGTFAYNVLHTKVADVTKMVKMPTSGLGVPKGTPTSWLVVDFDKAQAAWNYEGLSVGPAPDLGNNRGLTENDYGGWLQAGWDTEIAGMPFRGNIGGRMVETEVDAHSFSLNGAGNMSATDSTQRYHDFLPSMNVVFEPHEDLLLRLNLSQVMSRPDLGSLAGDYISVSGSSRSINVSNPNLKPFRANTADFSVEWYYGKGAMLSVSGFFKKVNSFITSYKSTQLGTSPFNIPAAYNGVSKTISLDTITAACGASCNPLTDTFAFTESVNTKGGHIDGVEVNWQQPFSFLPGPFANFGSILNGTFVESDMFYPASATSANGFYSQLLNQSRWSYNATLYYDDTVFQARASIAYRSHYYTALPGSYNDYEATDDTFNVDLSASYKIDQNFMITLDALNVTNQAQRQYTGYNDSNNKYVYVNHVTGREVYMGIKYNF